MQPTQGNSIFSALETLATQSMVCGPSPANLLRDASSQLPPLPQLTDANPALLIASPSGVWNLHMNVWDAPPCTCKMESDLHPSDWKLDILKNASRILGDRKDANVLKYKEKNNHLFKKRERKKGS